MSFAFNNIDGIMEKRLKINFPTVCIKEEPVNWGWQRYRHQHEYENDEQRPQLLFSE